MTALQRVFSFEAVDLDGSRQRGVLTATDANEARELLRRRSWFPTSIRPARRGRTRSISRADTAAGFRALSDLLVSGLPVNRALEVLKDLAPPTWRNGIDPMQEAVREGNALSTALSYSGLGISQFLIAIVQSGESGGGLPAAVERAASHSERIAKREAEVRAALAYPTTVLTVGSVCLLVLMIVVVPRFANLLVGTGAALPFSTRILILSSEVVKSSIAPAGLLCLTLTASGLYALHDVEWRQRCARFALSIPILGPLRHAALSARLLEALGALLASGVPIRRALAAAVPAAADQEMTRRVERAVRLIDRGLPVAHSLGTEAVLTLTSVRLLRLGEELGTLANACARAATLEYAFFDRALTKLVRGIEPTLILTLASVISLVAMALLQAVYSMRPL